MCTRLLRSSHFLCSFDDVFAIFSSFFTFFFVLIHSDFFSVSIEPTRPMAIAVNVSPRRLCAVAFSLSQSRNDFQSHKLKCIRKCRSEWKIVFMQSHECVALAHVALRSGFHFFPLAATKKNAIWKGEKSSRGREKNIVNNVICVAFSRRCSIDDGNDVDCAGRDIYFSLPSRLNRTKSAEREKTAQNKLTDARENRANTLPHFKLQFVSRVFAIAAIAVAGINW